MRSERSEQLHAALRNDWATVIDPVTFDTPSVRNVQLPFARAPRRSLRLGLPIPEGGNARAVTPLRRSFVIVGYIPYFTLSGKVGSLILALGDDNGVLHFAGTVARGFSARMRIELANLLENDHVTVPSTVGGPQRGVEHWVVPRYTAEVRFLGWTSSGHLRSPMFLRLR